MPTNDYGCFRCGTIGGDTKMDMRDEIPICAECGENALVTLQQALDILNDYWLTNKYEAHELDEDLIQFLREEGEVI